MAATLIDGCTPVSSAEDLKMGDTSLETFDSSLETSTSQTDAASDDEDDELLALRIAALESIKLKESKQANKTPVLPQKPKKPDFVIKSHPKRSNLLSIVTCEEEYETSIPRKQCNVPSVAPFFDPTVPPPGFARKSPPARYSRSPARRYSRSPGRRWGSRSPLPRRRSISPFRSRRRSFSRSPIRRSKSPLRRRSRSPPPRMSPSFRRTPSPSEWETDTESEEENTDIKEEEDKENKSNKKVNTEKKSVSNEEDDPDASVDDVLKLDATAEVDEFSAFLNEFEDEVLAPKEEVKESPEKKVKKTRPETEKKCVNGKRLRKKIKLRKATPPPTRYKSRSPGRRRTPSPRWKMGAKAGGVRSPGRNRSPGRRYFSPARGRDGVLSPKRRNLSPSLSPDSKLKRSKMKSSPAKRSSKSPELRNAKSKERSKEKSFKESKPVETSAEKEERERKEYQERLKKLPTPDREVLEARRKKFEKNVDISSSEHKKISLKSDKVDRSLKKFDRRGESNSEEDEVNADIGDTLDMFDEKQKSSGVSVNDEGSAMRKSVTDLRVQLHKKRQALGSGGAGISRKDKAPARGKHPLLRSVSPSSEHNSDGLDDDDFGPVHPSGRRKVVPPGKVPVKARLKISVENRSEEESDRSPSPPPKKLTRKRLRSGDSMGSSGDITGIGGRRILVVRKEVSKENSPEDISITTASNPRKGIKKSMHLRLGEKIEQAQFSENEIYAEMLRQQEEKRQTKKIKREKKEKKIKKKNKKIKKLLDEEEESSDVELKESVKHDLVLGADSDEELFRFFEDQEQSPEERKKLTKDSVCDKARSRRSSGDNVRQRISSGEGGRPQIGDVSGKIKSRLGKKVGPSGDRARTIGKDARRNSEELLLNLEKFQGSTDEENLDILEKMKRKNEKRLRRMREIEQDKLMFA